MIKNKRSGISLIVLVITIIVIIILAVAVILSIANNNPIENAKNAKDKNNQATLEEAAKIAYASIYAEQKIKGDSVSDNAITEKLRDALKDQGFSSEDLNKVEVTKNGLYVAKYAPTIPNGFVSSKADGENNISTGLVIYDGESEVNNENVDTARKTRNQFVWVPVDDISKFIRESFKDVPLDMTKYKETYNESEKQEFDQMYKSVEKYHGFYVARYEASKGSDGLAKSVKNKYPWNNIGFSNNRNMTVLTGGAYEAARLAYQNSDDKKAKDPISTLMFGVQFDEIVRWLKNSYSNLNSEEFAWTDNRKLINTGSNERFKLNNIYDIYDNMMEWTIENYNDNARMTRGNAYKYDYKPTLDALYYRALPIYPASGNTNIGFRMAIYLK